MSLPTPDPITPYPRPPLDPGQAPHDPTEPSPTPIDEPDPDRLPDEEPVPNPDERNPPAVL